MTLDLHQPLRDAIMEAASITSRIGEWMGEPAVFTRRPIPGDAPSKCILINPDAAVGDEDGLTSDRPFVVRDIAVYGDQPDDFREVEEVGYLLRDLFHRQKFSVRPDGFSVIDIIAAGPTPAPVDDEGTVGRLVTLTIRLRRN